MRRLRHLLSACSATLALAAGTVLSLATPASAQSSDGFGEIFQKDFSRRDLPILAHALQLDDTQKLIIETLFEQYDASIEQGINELKDGWLSQREKWDKAGPDEITRIIFGGVEEWAGKKTQLRDQLIADISEQVLNDQQQQQWPSVVRRLTRMKSLNKGRLSGENVDLFVVAKEIGVDPEDSAAVQSLMDQYEVALDQQIQARDTALNAWRRSRNEAMQTKDTAAYLQSVERLIAARVDLRDTNEQYMLLVAAAMPSDLAEKFTQAARERAFPRVYRPTQIHRLIKAARELSGLQPQQLTALSELEGSYNGELGVLNDTMVQMIKQSDAQQERARAEQQMARMTGIRAPKPEDPMREEFRKREQLNQTYMERLQGILTPEQWTALPGASEAGDMPLRSMESDLPPTGTLRAPDGGAPGSRRRGAGGLNDGTSKD
jgi:hypothetical protein